MSGERTGTMRGSAENLPRCRGAETAVPSSSFPAGPEVSAEIIMQITESSDSPRRKLASLYAQGRLRGEDIR